MGKENTQPSEGFGFTEQEQLYERISDKRFRAILADERSAIHNVEVSSNTFGEFLFVTVSQPVEQERQFVTFWGAGYHEYRERWLTTEWRWYDTQQFHHMIPQKITPEDAQALIQARLDEIAPTVTPAAQSKRAQLYEKIADLTDEDGAISELEDLGVWDDEDLE